MFHVSFEGWTGQLQGSLHCQRNFSGKQAGNWGGNCTVRLRMVRENFGKRGRVKRRYLTIKLSFVCKTLFTEYGVATQRICLQRGPSDSEDRCAYTKWNYRKVLMCFCKGDLCNNATTLKVNLFIFVSIMLFIATL